MMPPEPTDERQTLLGFARHVLGVSLYDGSDGGPNWQGLPYFWFEHPARRVQGSIVAPNGSGKSSNIVAPLALAYAALHRRAKVVVMVPDGTQLDEQVWPNLEQLRDRLPPAWDWKYRRITSPTGSRIIGRSVDEPGRAEGFHKEDDLDGPLLIIVDEAKSMPDEIFDAIDKCTVNALLYISSPGPKRGRFYDSHSRLAAQFLRKKVGLADCPHISPERIAAVIATHGADSAYTRATLHGEFMPSDDSFVYPVPLEALQACLASPPALDFGSIGSSTTLNGTVAFCDFAGGRDENVLAIRRGNRVEIAAAWKDRNEMAAVGRFLTEFKKHRLRPEQIWGDADGAGKPMCARLDEVGWPINRFHGGSAALASREYANRSSEVWHAAGRAIADGKAILPPDDGVLHAQLTTRRTVFKSDGLMALERKEDMARRGLSSPDRADAVVAVLALNAPLSDDYFGSTGSPTWSAGRSASLSSGSERFETLPVGD